MHILAIKVRIHQQRASSPTVPPEQRLKNKHLPAHIRPAVDPRRLPLPFPLPDGDPLQALLWHSLLQNGAHPSLQKPPMKRASGLLTRNTMV